MQHRAQPRRRRDHAVRSRRFRASRDEPRARDASGAQHPVAGAMPRGDQSARGHARTDRSDRRSRRHRPSHLRRSSPSSRAASTRPPHAKRRAPSAACTTGTARDRRTVGRRSKPDMYAMLDVVHAELPRGPPALPHGRRFPGGPGRGRRGAAWTCSTASRRRAWAQRTAFFTATGRLNIKRAEFRTDPAAARRGVRLRRLHPLLAGLPAAPVRVATRSWGCACSRCTMYISSSR